MLEMNKLLKKRMLIISISLAFLLLINIGVSYSYYLGKVVGNESSTTVSLTSAGIIINYENNSGVITDDNITPGWSTTKKFSVSSTFNQASTSLSKLWYVVRLCVDDNEFLSDKIVYSLSTDGEITGNGKALDNVENKGIATGTNEEGIVIGTGYFVSGSNQHNYNITFKYVDSEIISSGSKFNVHVVVEAALETTVSINLDGGNISGSSQIATTRYSSIILEEPKKNGYYFEGWEIISGNGTINGNELYINDTNITLKANYREQSFADETWEEIAINVRNGNTAGYKIGDTKEIVLAGLTNSTTKPTFTLRIANKSTPSECSGATFSQSSCGFVVEFADIILINTFNSTNTSDGGWPKSQLYKIVNDTIWYKLPNDLRNAIINTRVISAHNQNGSNNFTSDDKLFLLGAGEVYVDNSIGNVRTNDSAFNQTRQLDFYSVNNVTTETPLKAQKKFNDTNYGWWLRTPWLGSGGIICVGSDAGWRYIYANDTSYGIAPAFRIG